jgi:hypothetical protein
MASAGLRQHQRHLAHLHLIKSLDAAAAAAVQIRNISTSAIDRGAKSKLHQMVNLINK